jgi:hypothetical protein
MLPRSLRHSEFGSCREYIHPSPYPDVTVVLDFDINRCSQRMRYVKAVDYHRCQIWLRWVEFVQDVDIFFEKSMATNIDV